MIMVYDRLWDIYKFDLPRIRWDMENFAIRDLEDRHHIGRFSVHFLETDKIYHTKNGYKFWFIHFEESDPKPLVYQRGSLHKQYCQLRGLYAALKGLWSQDRLYADMHW